MNQHSSHPWNRVRAPARLRLVLLGAAALGGYASIASAATDTASAATTGETAVGEVVVTARHRAESLQSVPIAISVVQGAQTASKNLNDIEDISSQVPAVDFRTGASNKDRTVFIRGAGTISTSPGVEPSVSTVVDGVVMARAGQSTVDLLDLDHIEVLRGPQGTLFGKNASAGVINIVTKGPTSTPSGYIDAGIYEGGEYRGSAGISGPIVPGKLEGLLALFGGTYEGNVKNLYNGQWDNGYTHEGGRGRLVATPNDNLTLTLNADYAHSIDTVPTGVWASANQTAYPTGAVSTNAALATQLASQGIVPSADNKTISDNINSNVVDDNGGVSLQADWNLGHGYTLTSISAWRDWHNVQHQDYDQLSAYNASLPQVADIGHVSFQQVSEELRIASPKGQFIDYVAGLYYLDAVDHEVYERDVTHIVAGASQYDYGINDYGSADGNYAVFGEANLNFTKQFRAIVGFREIWDDLSFYTNRVSTARVANPGLGVTANPVTGVQPSFAANGTTDKNGYAGRLGLQYDVTGDINVYATYSRGYKGPAYNVFFNMAAGNTPVLTPETSNSYEVGVKSQFFEHRLQIDLDVFRTDFNNYQANSTQVVSGALVTNLVNAGTVTTRGVEGDILATPIRGLSLTADFAYDDAYVVDFPCPPGSAVSCNINGKPLPFAPKWKYHLDADYRFPIAEKLDLDLDTDYNWQSDTQYQLGEFADTIQHAYGVWNASVGLVSTPDGWFARVLVKNIADQHYSSYLSHGDLAGLVRWVPRDDDRYFGLNVHKDF